MTLIYPHLHKDPKTGRHLSAQVEIVKPDLLRRDQIERNYSLSSRLHTSLCTPRTILSSLLSSHHTSSWHLSPSLASSEVFPQTLITVSPARQRRKQGEQSLHSGLWQKSASRSSQFCSLGVEQSQGSPEGLMIIQSPLAVFYWSDLGILPDPATVWQPRQLLLDLGQNFLNCISTHRHKAMPLAPSPKT